MATIKTKMIKFSKQNINYLKNKTHEFCYSSSHQCSVDYADTDFELLAKSHGLKSDVKVLRVIQSFSHEDFNSMTPETANKIGFDVAKSRYEKHPFFVVTHQKLIKVDGEKQPHYHNHIIVSPVNLETKKNVDLSKFKERYSLMEISNKICKERGLSYFENTKNFKLERLPEEARGIARRQGFSWVLDMKSKADIARFYSTSFEEYSSVLKSLNIDVHVANKNITYFYPDHKKGKRGNKLGHEYDKEGLLDSFKLNEKKFSKDINKKQELKHEIDLISKGKSTPNDIAENLYSKNTGESSHDKKHREMQKNGMFSDFKMENLLLPKSVLSNARSSNIIDYCKRNKIELIPHKDGSYKLKGKDFVEVNTYQWENLKNNTKGSLIDFVMVKEKQTYFGAIAKITGNKSVLDLEKQMGEIKLKFQSFYFPKEKSLMQKSLHNMNHFFQAFDLKSHNESSLLKNKNVQLLDNKTLFFLSENERQGCLEYKINEDGKINKKSRGLLLDPFKNANSKGKELIAFKDPFSYFHYKESKQHKSSSHENAEVVFFDLNEASLMKFVTENNHIEKLHFIEMDHKSVSKEDLDFFNVLKGKFKKKGIELCTTSAKEVSKNPELSRSLDRGLDISF